MQNIRQTGGRSFNGLFSRTTGVSQQQKGKAILYFNEAKDGQVAAASDRSHENHLHLASSNYAST